MTQIREHRKAGFPLRETDAFLRTEENECESTKHMSGRKYLKYCDPSLNEWLKMFFVSLLPSLCTIQVSIK